VKGFSTPVLLGTVLAIALGAGFFLLRSWEKESYVFVPVIRGTLVHEASASGKVEPPTRVDLYFKNNGRLVARSAEIGERVEPGDELARQDTRELNAQLAQIQAGVDVQKARLAQLLAGTSAEDVRVAETAVQNARRAVVDAEDAAKKTIQDAYTKADDAVRTKADVVFVDPRASDPQISFVVSNQQVELNVESQRKAVEQSLLAWKASLMSLSSTELDAALQSAQQRVQAVSTLLDYVAQALNAHISNVPTATLESWKASVSGARATVNASATALVAAAESLEAARGALVLAEDGLALKKAPARAEDIALYEAQIREAEARIGLIESQIADTRLLAPVAGIVTLADGEVGEIVGPGAATVSVTPSGALQVKLNVSENNIAGVNVGQKVRITLDAFPGAQEWRGTVVAVDPAETILGGAVYYQTTVLFDEADERIKSGMTANAWIVTTMKDDALYVPASALHDRDGSKFVLVRASAQGDVAERAVTLGVTGKMGVVEVLNGLSEGDEVVIGGDI
jgi:HlyD family secretion protein